MPALGAGVLGVGFSVAAAAAAAAVSVAAMVSRTKVRTSSVSTCTAIPSTGVSSAGVARRDGDEPDVAAGHPPELGDEPVEVPPAVKDDVPGDGVDEPADRARVGQRPGRQHPARQAGEERLLAGDAIQVPALEAVALPDEGERVGAADDLRACGEVDPGPDLVLGPLEAHRHPADRLGHLDEPGEVDLRVVVDRELRELLDGRDQRAAAGVAGPPVELGTGDPCASRAAFASSVARPYAELILWRSVAIGEGDEGVAGDRDRDGARVRPGWNVQQDDRVGVQLAFVVACAQFRQQPRRQGVARCVRAAVQPHEERRERLLGLRCHGPAADDVARDDAVGQRPVDHPAVPGADQQRERQHRGDRAPDRARRPGAAGGRLRSSHGSGRPRGGVGRGDRPRSGGRHTSRPARACHDPPDTARPCPTSRGRWSPHHDRPTRTPMSITVG